jgi:hypothetical protein
MSKVTLELHACAAVSSGQSKADSLIAHRRTRGLVQKATGGLLNDLLVKG